MLDTLTIDSYAPRLGEKFRLRVHTDRALEVELVEVTPLADMKAAGHHAPGKRVPFSIVFRGPVDPIVPQRTYPVEHDTMGTHELFLVPIGPGRTGPAGMLYEAIFT